MKVRLVTFSRGKEQTVGHYAQDCVGTLCGKLSSAQHGSLLLAAAVSSVCQACLDEALRTGAVMIAASSWTEG